MSYNKNTINMSFLDGVKEVLDDTGTEYNIQNKKTVRGRGCNDDLCDDTTQSYNLRRLFCKKFVILERMMQYGDCDVDDVLESVRFETGNEPSDWEYVREVK
jgi:hypothetical protein